MFQLLFLYATPIPSVSLADVLLLIIYPFLILKMIKKGKLNLKKDYAPFIALFIYILFQTLIILFGKDINYITNIVATAGRFMFYLFTVIYFVPYFFDRKIGISLYKKICVISTIFLFLQILVVKFWGYYIVGTIPGFPLMRNELAEFNQTIMNAGYLIRPRSFFAEPAHYVSYVSIYLAIGLFTKKNNYKEYFAEIIISIGIIVSNSATGMIVLAFLWAMWILKNFNIRRIDVKKLLMIIILFPIAINIVISSEYFKTFLERTFGFGGEGLGSAAVGRFSNFMWAFSSENVSVGNFIFGRGMIEIDKYIPGIPSMFYYFGIIGSLIFVLIMLSMFIKAKYQQKILIMLIIVMSIGGDAIFGPNCLLSFLFIINDENKKDLPKINEIKYV